MRPFQLAFVFMACCGTSKAQEVPPLTNEAQRKAIAVFEQYENRWTVTAEEFNELRDQAIDGADHTINTLEALLRALDAHHNPHNAELIINLLERTTFPSAKLRENLWWLWAIASPRRKVGTMLSSPSEQTTTNNNCST